MIKQISLVLAIFISGIANANEMFVVSPTDYVISGVDRYSNPAYTITAKTRYEKELLTIISLDIQIYDQSISVSSEILSQVNNPNLTKIRVINDAGIFGSYFYIDIPFGEDGRCREAKKYHLSKSVHISSLGKSNGGDLKVSISDPCN